VKNFVFCGILHSLVVTGYLRMLVLPQLLAALLTISINDSWNQAVFSPICQSVGRSVRKVYCGKMADWIRMRRLREGVLDWIGDHWMGRDSFGGEFGASHCNL